jgi:regulator of RNase E activity RraA
MEAQSPMINSEITSQLRQLYTGAVHDVLRGLGHSNFVLPHHIRLLDPSQKMAGPIWTVSGKIDESITAHDSLLGWTGLLSKAPSGHIIVCQPNNHQVALMGELSAETLKNKGVLGYLVDGGCRDTDFILGLRFPVAHSFFTPADIVARWIPTEFESSLTIGSVVIHNGDYVLCDRDGAVIIPKALITQVIQKTVDVALTENKVRDAIRGGVDPVQAYLQYGKF